MKGLYVVLLFIMVCVWPSARSSNETLCVFDNQMTSFYSHKQVMDCFFSVPYSEELSSQTLSVLSSAMELYAFLDIATHPPDAEHFHPPVDLLGEFSRLRTTKFKTDFDFQNALKRVFIPLGDAHTNYYAFWKSKRSEEHTS